MEEVYTKERKPKGVGMTAASKLETILDPEHPAVSVSPLTPAMESHYNLEEDSTEGGYMDSSSTVRKLFLVRYPSHFLFYLLLYIFLIYFFFNSILFVHSLLSRNTTKTGLEALMQVSLVSFYTMLAIFCQRKSSISLFKDLPTVMERSRLMHSQSFGAVMISLNHFTWMETSSSMFTVPQLISNILMRMEMVL